MHSSARRVYREAVRSSGDFLRVTGVKLKPFRPWTFSSEVYLVARGYSTASRHDAVLSIADRFESGDVTAQNTLQIFMYDEAAQISRE